MAGTFAARPPHFSTGRRANAPFAAALLCGGVPGRTGPSEAYLAEARGGGRFATSSTRSRRASKKTLICSRPGAEDPPGTARLTRVAAGMLGYVREFDLVRDLTAGAGADVTG
ncbi:MAG: hypothetical protein ABR610_02130 [Thermoanaerobaculia bacterium]